MDFLNTLVNGKGTIQVRVDKPYYMAGDIISGSLLVDVRDSIKCNVYVAGKEKVSWSEDYTRTVNGESRTEKRWFTNGRSFFKQKVPRFIVLFNVQHSLPPGQYVYPFSYQLPFGLPGCFDNDGNGGVKAKIEYSIKGAVCVDGLFNRDLKKKQCVTVYAQLAGYVAPSFDHVEQTIRFLCCFPQGKAALRVAMDKNMYGPGDVPQIHCDIQNHSSRDIRSMKCHLRRTTVVTGSGKRRVLTKTICTATFPGVPAGMSISQPQPFQLTGSGMFPSTLASFITVSYTIDVVCDIALCPDVKLKLPIALGAPSLLVAPITVASAPPMYDAPMAAHEGLPYATEVSAPAKQVSPSSSFAHKA
ncbi:hypothetical protein DYB25_003895 [Aphanomyces astaci]|uniref:Arrestin C-terminal-like domain-containing protein n=1 Tax=Aphanomyces astaci TaxID=112090 RepID=A0A397F0F6_APHAT|nr:hypothetical protein DYB25_003895 [Aphanomyces astaci]RHY18788.1 hypothetical protein DYB36_003565 [Aphanomyces astaci]RHZ05002.1 hypothetical protein DYB31_003895 [Aphanomyces astaci]